MIDWGSDDEGWDDKPMSPQEELYHAANSWGDDVSVAAIRRELLEMIGKGAIATRIHPACDRTSSPVHAAAMKNHSNWIGPFLEVGVTFKELSSTGYDAVSNAVHNGSLAFVKELHARGVVDPNGHRGPAGICLIAQALKGGTEPRHIETIQFLLDIGCATHVSDDAGNYPVHLAVGSSAALHMLHAAGANLDEVDAKGNAPIHLATSKCVRWGEPFLSSVAYLLSAGVDIDTANKKGEVPRDTMMADPRLASLLRSSEARSAALAALGEVVTPDADGPR